MRLLADESIEAQVIDRLRTDGHDVTAIVELDAGASDAHVLARTEKGGFVLVTNDKDFAHLAFLQQQAKRGILLVRLPRSRAASKAERVVAVVRQFGERLRRHMTVVEEMSVRRRRLPNA
jgi:predicted nuclease of predicted toxin-antitoxin system